MKKSLVALAMAVAALSGCAVVPAYGPAYYEPEPRYEPHYAPRPYYYGPPAIVIPPPIIVPRHEHHGWWH